MLNLSTFKELSTQEEANKPVNQLAKPESLCTNCIKVILPSEFPSIFPRLF